MILDGHDITPFAQSFTKSDPPPPQVLVLFDGKDCTRTPTLALFSGFCQEGLMDGLAYLWDERVYAYGRAVPGIRGWKWKRSETWTPNGDLLPVYINLMQSEDHGIRRAAIAGLGLFGDEAVEAVPFLAYSVYNDETQTVRFLSADRLGQIGPPAMAAVPALILTLEEALEEGDVVLQEAVRDALILTTRQTTRQNFGKDAKLWTEWWWENQ